MTFKEFYKGNLRGWYREDELPTDVRENLFQLLEKEDRHIGIIVYHSHVLDDGNLRFEGMKVGYYWRTLKPVLTLEPWRWFWRAKRVEY